MGILQILLGGPSVPWYDYRLMSETLPRYDLVDAPTRVQRLEPRPAGAWVRYDDVDDHLRALSRSQYTKDLQLLNEIVTSVTAERALVASLHAQIDALRDALTDLVEDTTDRYDLDDPSLNPGTRSCVQNAQKVLAS